MVLSCSCDYDDSDGYYEPGGVFDPAKHMPCKCEACDAELTEHDEGLRFIVTSFVDGDDFPPMPDEHPDYLPQDEPECSDLSRHWNQALDAAAADLEDWEYATGWSWDHEKFEQTSNVFLCERCSGLYTTLHVDLGYCSVGPFTLIEDHCEYVYETTGKAARWRRDGNGVLQPVRASAA